MPHGFSHLQKWNPAKRVEDGQEAGAAVPVGKKNGALPDRLHFIQPL